MPITLAVITSTFPEEERGTAIGVWTGVAGGGGILGMFLSALLVDVADWRWLFVLPVVLTVVALAMTLKSVPDSRERSAHRFDTVGALVSAVAVAKPHLRPAGGPRARLDRARDPDQSRCRSRRRDRLRGLGVAPPGRRAAGRAPVPGTWTGWRLDHAAGGLRRPGGHRRGALPVLPGRARLVGAAVHAGPDAHGRHDDDDLRPRPQAGRAHRPPARPWLRASRWPPSAWPSWPCSSPPTAVT
ncbi:MFS transporter [Nonomuraea ferruginea]